MLTGSLLTPLDPLTWAKGLSNDALREVVVWVQDGARAAIADVAHIIGATTTPQLTSTWFSAAYWRVAGLATLLTVPFLFAAALHAVIRSDLALLGRAVFGYLPLALIGVSIAAQIAMLLLSATDEMSNVVSGLAVGGASHFLTQAGEAFVLSGGSLFIAFLVALIATAAAIALALEMLVREAAVYIIVLMLPMAFAALVWPARRIWAVRLVEMLVALIVSKFVIVAVLSLAGAAYGQSGTGSVSRALTAMSLLLLSTFAPWTMLRLLPFTEVAASAAGALRQEMPQRRRLSDGSATISGLGRPADPAAAVSGEVTAGDATDPVDLIATRLRTQAAGAAEFERTDNGGSRSGGGPRAMPSESTEETEAPSRLPGMDPIWQAENGAWPPMNLGPGGWGGPTEYVPPDNSPVQPEAGSGSGAPPPSPEADPAVGASQVARAANDAAPMTDDPARVAGDPVPATTDPAPVTNDPAPAPHDPGRATNDLAPATNHAGSATQGGPALNHPASHSVGPSAGPLPENPDNGPAEP